eukprot:m.332891 g.332891  ORF g.332891 m.332891 type:complete len:119 (+) comp19779_c3_seq7:1576-1932(+)
MATVCACVAVDPIGVQPSTTNPPLFYTPDDGRACIVTVPSHDPDNCALTCSKSPNIWRCSDTPCRSATSMTTQEGLTGVCLALDQHDSTPNTSVLTGLVEARSCAGAKRPPAWCLTAG